jgi:hypothetical protein
MLKATQLSTISDVALHDTLYMPNCGSLIPGKTIGITGGPIQKITLSVIHWLTAAAQLALRELKAVEFLANSSSPLELSHPYRKLAVTSISGISV